MCTGTNSSQEHLLNSSSMRITRDPLGSLIASRAPRLATQPPWPLLGFDLRMRLIITVSLLMIALMPPQCSRPMGKWDKNPSFSHSSVNKACATHSFYCFSLPKIYKWHHAVYISDIWITSCWRLFLKTICTGLKGSTEPKMSGTSWSKGTASLMLLCYNSWILKLCFLTP
jgi:hypothetical protein